MRIFYLHGFASSPASRKARFFAARLGQEPAPLETPALDQGDFPHLTISGQLALLERLLGGEPAILIGSSLGGYLAALYAARHPEIERSVLLAPAFNFARLWRDAIGPGGLEAWKREGVISVFHYGQNRQVPLCYSFLEDALRFEPFPEFCQPALLFHGRQDTSVPLQSSVKFAGRHANARLVQLESGHEMTDALEQIWLEARPFLSNRLVDSEC
ncbi:MAG: YqiA/YcfP family alpha/beta fold hydrolase [Bryobacteraceae bacterium]